MQQIGVHVDNFYRNAAVEVPPHRAARIAEIDAGSFDGGLATRLGGSQRPKDFIKFALTKSIIERISVGAQPDVSFLPEEYTFTETDLMVDVDEGQMG